MVFLATCPTQLEITIATGQCKPALRLIYDAEGELMLYFDLLGSADVGATVWSALTHLTAGGG